MKNFHFNKGDHIAITFNSSASSRTKGRVKDHGPRFVVFRTTTSFRGAGSLSRRSCALVGSLTTGWDGWLPLDEIELQE